MTSKSHALYYAAVKADDALHRELVRVYGEKEAAHARYTPRIWTDRKLKAAGLRKLRADARLRKEFDKSRANNPLRKRAR